MMKSPSTAIVPAARMPVKSAAAVTAMWVRTAPRPIAPTSTSAVPATATCTDSARRLASASLS